MDLPFLTTSHADREPHEIRRTLHNTRNEIENVKKRIEDTIQEIEKASVLLRELQTAEKELLQAAEAAARLLSPFDEIPTDILGDIVEYVTESNVIIPGTDEGIWPLTYVCSSWRNAILSLPHLWSSFTIVDHLRISPLPILSTLLARSGSHPLSFSIPMTEGRRFPAEVMQMLMNHSERWKSVHIWIDPTSFFIFLDIYKRLPLLESLRIDLPESEREFHGIGDAGDQGRVFEYAPRLTKLEFTGSCPALPIRFRFPFHQLREFRCVWDPDEYKLGGLWRLDEITLMRFRGLRRLDISELRWWRRPDADAVLVSRPIELPGVTHLRLQSPDTLVTAFRLPSLVSLDLEDVYMDSSVLASLQRLFGSLALGQLKEVSLELRKEEWVKDPWENVLELLEHSVFDYVVELVIRPRYPSCCMEVFLSRATFRHPQTEIRVAGGKPPIRLHSLRCLSIDLFHFKKCRGEFAALEEFIASRTSLIDKVREEGGREGTSSVVPVRLEDVRVGFWEFGQPITLLNFERLRAGLVELME